MQGGYSRSRLVSYIVDSLESGKSVSGLASGVAAYLVENGKISELDSIMRDAQELRAQKYGVVELSARSAHKLEAAHLAEVKTLAGKQYAGTKRVITHQIQDDSVVGGTNLSFPHTNLDVTIRAKLNQLKEAIA
jgi:F0F1-type ATP synthase delta subunit